MLKLKRNKAKAAKSASDDVFPQLMQLLDRSQGFFKRHGIQYDQLRLIVNTKFKLASRNRTTSIWRNKPKAESAHPLRGSFLLNLLIGFVLILMVFIPMPLVAFTTFYATLFLFTFLTMLTN